MLVRLDTNQLLAAVRGRQSKPDRAVFHRWKVLKFLTPAYRGSRGGVGDPDRFSARACYIAAYLATYHQFGADRNFLRRVVKFLDGVKEEDAHALLSGNIDQWQFERFAADGASVAHIRFPADLTRAIVDCVMRVSLAYRAESSGEGRITARTTAKK